MIWIHAALIMIWVILILWNYEELQFTKRIKEVTIKLREKADNHNDRAREWHYKTMEMYERASKRYEEAGEELNKCKAIFEELEQRRNELI